MKLSLKTINYVLVFVVFVLSLLLFQSTFISNKRMNQRIVEIEAERDQQLALASQRDSLLDADEWLLKYGDLDSSKANLNVMLDHASPELRERLEIRLSYIEELMNLRQEGTETISRKDQLINKQRQQIEWLESESDSLTDRFATVQVRLNEMLTKRDKEINRLELEVKKNEKIKVISFAGQKGATVHYMGEVVDGKANGGGIGIWTTGSVYRGEWRNNLRHGKGSFQWKDGERYEGNYVDGKREGEGTYYWPSGERYEGQWVADQRTGQGTLFDLDGNVRYKGEWLNDVPATTK